MTRMDLWKAAVDRVCHISTMRSREIETKHPEPDELADPMESRSLATAITIAGAAVIRLCRGASSPIAALDLAIEGLQGARELMASRHRTPSHKD